MNTRKAQLIPALASVLLALASPSLATSVPCAGRAVTVEVRAEDGRTLPFYPAPARSGSNRFYAEAVKGERYSILVRSNVSRRVGLVVAVDGRNIISGKKSTLKSDEQMYILEPYGSGEYSGWRTAQDTVNRFYFTTADDSYAAAFKDESAMGVIAVAVYQEVPPPTPKPISWWQRMSSDSRKDEAAAPPAGSASAPSAAGAMKSRDSLAEQKSQPGTGYGDEQYSPSYRVAFEAELQPREKTIIKYEWRSTLCRLGVIPAERPERPENRLWDGEFAPPPPPRRGR
jgi:hypothetical protein